MFKFLFFFKKKLYLGQYTEIIGRYNEVLKKTDGCISRQYLLFDPVVG